MDAPIPIEEKAFSFKNKQGTTTIEVIIGIKKNNITFKTELSENPLNKRRFFSKYSIDSIKEKNQFFFLCKNLNDIFRQIELLTKDNKSIYILDHSKIDLSIPTNMPLAPEIKVELFEEQQDLSAKVNDLNEYILNKEKVNENKISLLIKENKEIKNLINILIKENREMKETINSYLSNFDLLFKNQLKIINHLKIIDQEWFDKIKDWIGGDKNKIKFELIFNFNDNFSNEVRNIYHSLCNISAPAIFIFITEKSVFGAYCPNYYCKNNNSSWINDSNAFLFSLNLNKKYPAKVNRENYHTGICGFHFNDITFCGMTDRKGSFGTSGTYLNVYELDGNNTNFYVEQFIVYKVKFI